MQTKTMRSRSSRKVKGGKKNEKVVEESYGSGNDESDEMHQVSQQETNETKATGKKKEKGAKKQEKKVGNDVGRVSASASVVKNKRTSRDSDVEDPKEKQQKKLDESKRKKSTPQVMSSNAVQRKHIIQDSDGESDSKEKRQKKSGETVKKTTTCPQVRSLNDVSDDFMLAKHFPVITTNTSCAPSKKVHQESSIHEFSDGTDEEAVSTATKGSSSKQPQGKAASTFDKNTPKQLARKVSSKKPVPLEEEDDMLFEFEVSDDEMLATTTAKNDEVELVSALTGSSNKQPQGKAAPASEKKAPKQPARKVPTKKPAPLEEGNDMLFEFEASDDEMQANTTAKEDEVQLVSALTGTPVKRVGLGAIFKESKMVDVEHYIQVEVSKWNLWQKFKHPSNMDKLVLLVRDPHLKKDVDQVGINAIARRKFKTLCNDKMAALKLDRKNVMAHYAKHARVFSERKWMYARGIPDDAALSWNSIQSKNSMKRKSVLAKEAAELAAQLVAAEHTNN
eukprot:Phypoly_transcript_05291.p1 GENE.Phypoly_transcript_05291~~Phypoly_transcript_05291.p1  ORF type:complete len:507 (+),score=117.49 Phypoly_transcript_05291:139-1659(+)